MPQEFTHLLPLERPIWARYLASTTEEFLSLVYDLHLGEGAPVDPAWSEGTAAIVAAVSRKRVDVVGETADSIIIFEVKPRAGMGAMGQLLTYRELYLREARPTKPIRMMVVCERVEPDVPRVYGQYGIEIAIV
ncbi:hypothetical protein ES703_42601 [subsurface metagenome]